MNGSKMQIKCYLWNPLYLSNFPLVVLMKIIESKILVNQFICISVVLVSPYNRVHRNKVLLILIFMATAYF